MAIGSQSGEDAVISKFFDDKKVTTGFFVDVGAADGLGNSNTNLLVTKGWKGILVEPNERDFISLRERYKDNSNVTLINEAIYSHMGELPFYVEPGQCSTLSEEFKKRAISIHGMSYETKLVHCSPLSSLLDRLNAPAHIDFLSIDAEGVDMIVLDTMNWEKYRVSLVCVEHSMPKEDLRRYMESKGYQYYTETSGNTFFVIKE